MGKDTLDQNQYFDALYDAICHSIKHWKRICAYIKAEMYDGGDLEDLDATEENWLCDYGETLHSGSCALCALFENQCDDCILPEKGNECSYEGSHWYRTSTSESWADMLENAKGLVKFLEQVKRELVEEHQW